MDLQLHILILEILRGKTKIESIAIGNAIKKVSSSYRVSSRGIRISVRNELMNNCTDENVTRICNG